MNTIEIYQKRQKKIQVTVTNDGTAINLTGYTCILYVVEYVGAQEALIENEASDITTNVLTFDISIEEADLEPGDYFYEISATNSDPIFSKTVAQGIFSVLNSHEANLTPEE